MSRAQRGADRRGTRGRVVRLVALAAVVVPLTAGCSVQDVIRFGWPVGVTPQAEAMRTLWTWAGIAALVVGAITWGAMFWAMIFHRKRKGTDPGIVPRQTQYNLPVELWFTVIPAVIVAVLFGFTVTVQNFVEADPNPDLKVDVTAFQWQWKFAYPDHQGTAGQPVSTLGTTDTIPLLVLPVGETIQFTQHSNDVIHSFYVPEFLFKRDVFPQPQVNDQDNVWTITGIDREGAFVGRCAELCGSYHSQMQFEVRAISKANFDQWLTLRSQTNPATGAPYTAGEALAALNCGQVCSPEAYTTYPFTTDRTQRSQSEPIAAAGN
ncbi:MAG: cytochrome c oxidase subunit [Pseudonocardiales bacterium]|nr:cytochrome c oxidase subunit [Pseudonocardiales bacterium]